MSKTSTHITKSIDSSIEINGKPEIIWDNITNVKIRYCIKSKDGLIGEKTMRSSIRKIGVAKLLDYESLS